MFNSHNSVILFIHLLLLTGFVIMVLECMSLIYWDQDRMEG